jgi:hypothetical protein
MFLIESGNQIMWAAGWKEMLRTAYYVLFVKPSGEQIEQEPFLTFWQNSKLGNFVV